MRPAFSMIWWVAPRACLTMCLHVSSSHHNCSFLLCWSLRITTLDRSLLRSPYLEFACSVEFCDHCFGYLFCQFSTHSFPPLIGKGSWKVSVPVSFSTEVPSVWLVPTHRVTMEPPCCAWYSCWAPTNLWWHQIVPKLIIIIRNKRLVVRSFLSYFNLNIIERANEVTSW